MLTDEEKKSFTNNLRQLIMDICYKNGIKREQLAIENNFTPRNFQRFDKPEDNKFLNSIDFLKQLAVTTNLSLNDFLTIITSANKEFDSAKEFSKLLKKSDKQALKKILTSNQTEILIRFIHKIANLENSKIQQIFEIIDK